MLINQDPQWNGVAASELQMFPELEFLDDNPLLPDDLFQSLSSELGIPLLSDEVSQNYMKHSQNYCEDQNENIEELSLQSPLSNTFEDFGLYFSQQEKDPETFERNKEIKLEPGSPSTRLPLSPSPSHSESSGSEWQQEIIPNFSSTDFKFTLETPPISPPHVSPPVSPPTITATPVVQQVQLIPVNTQETKNAKYTIANGNPAKRVCIQPKDNTHIKQDQPQKTIVLSAQDFAVLAQKAKQNQTYPLKLQSLSLNGPIKVRGPLNLQSTPLNHIKTENNGIKFQQQNHVKIINAIPNLHVPPGESVVNVPNTSVILNNKTANHTSIVVKNEPMGCDSIVIKKGTSNCAPIVIKNEIPIFNNIPGKQECEIKALKRQQRMIKNRESACLSRKKKKEYVCSLEKQISDLQEENKKLKSENIALKQRLLTLEDTMTSNNKLGNVNLNVNKKNAGILLGMILMVSLNVNGLVGILPQSKKLDSMTADIPSIIPNVRHGRSLLWTDSDTRIEEKLRDGFNKNKTIHHLMCPMYINQSESIRLDYELRRWIGGESDHDNWTAPTETKLDKKSLGEFLLPKSNVQKKLMNGKSHSRKIKSKNTHKINNIHTSNVNAVEVFSPVLREHASLFEALGRKDDTFYVVWFSGEHLLLPASRKNNTTRPKMALVLPAVPMNETYSTPANHITMMQIDCEVTNTQLLHLQQSVIPFHLRKTSKSENSKSQTETVNDILDATTVNLTRSHKPYFMKENDPYVLSTKNLRETYTQRTKGHYHNKDATYLLKEKFEAGFGLENVKSDNYESIKNTDERKPDIFRLKNIGHH
ncbi:hypothetical protein KPH14_008013 [Odynerus spinipes]|uniref:BZIP domain-containing protein n=1 Tax=Odynerus spinipes TaxID=1348599 RepID=A0AAD9RK44_9HYME|nr:hypothetical protein KPH14_008013 [Odynerus spinipes]